MYKTLLAILMLMAMVGCGTSRPLLQPDNMTVPTNTSSKKVEEAILEAAKSRNWMVISQKSGEIVLEQKARRHMAQVVIPYDTNSYSIKYKDSVELDYDPQEKTIHRTYNRWIKNLDKLIQQHLNK